MLQGTGISNLTRKYI